MAVSMAFDIVLTKEALTTALSVGYRGDARLILLPQQIAEAAVWLSAHWRPELFQGYYDTPLPNGKISFDSIRFAKDSNHRAEVPGLFALDALQGSDSARLPPPMEKALRFCAEREKAAEPPFKPSARRGRKHPERDTSLSPSPAREASATP